jgi:hypothetical protein
VDSLNVADTGCDVKGKGIKIEPNGAGTRIVVDSPVGTRPLVELPTNVITNAYTYWAWEKFEINRINLVATLSALSPVIIVDGDNQVLSAHAGNAQGKLLFFTVPNIESRSDGSLANGGNPQCQFGAPAETPS